MIKCFEYVRHLNPLLFSPASHTLMRRACRNDVVPPTVFLQSVQSLALDPDVRQSVAASLKSTCAGSGALYVYPFCCGFSQLNIHTSCRFALLISDDELVTMVQPKTPEHRITAPDILLLIDFIKATPSLKSHEQNWLPLCLPNFNDKGFLQVCSRWSWLV